jgi:hypothetical protein
MKNNSCESSVWERKSKVKNIKQNRYIRELTLWKTWEENKIVETKQTRGTHKLGRTERERQVKTLEETKWARGTHSLESTEGETS